MFHRQLGLAALCLVLAGPAHGAQAPRVKLATSLGEVVLELAPDKAPASVANFLGYVRAGFYDGTLFHRVIDGFMIQGGGFTQDFTRRDTRDPVRNEADSGLRNSTGSVAMARTSDPHSATAQFFINLADNAFLDHRSRDPQGWGYAVFGRVVEGMDVVERIAKVATGQRGSYSDVPVQPVLIQSATVLAE
jgi:peptidyl-prolyl cis-trans isomerase B (cyclophilin B)